MPHAAKIATCCFCGNRAALVLKGRDRHELSCSSCGAPLHDLKMLRSDAVDPAAHRPPARRTDHGPAKPLAAWERKALEGGKRRRSGDPRRAKKKKRKSLAKRFIEEAFDAIEDIFD